MVCRKTRSDLSCGLQGIQVQNHHLREREDWPHSYLTFTHTFSSLSCRNQRYFMLWPTFRLQRRARVLSPVLPPLAYGLVILVKYWNPQAMWIRILYCCNKFLLHAPPFIGFSSRDRRDYPTAKLEVGVAEIIVANGQKHAASISFLASKKSGMKMESKENWRFYWRWYAVRGGGQV